MARKFGQPAHEKHSALMQAFETAELGTPKDKVGNASYGFAGSTGMPRSPAQMASVKKAALTSAKNRGARAQANQPLNPKLHQAQTTSFGGLGVAKKDKKRGLLGM